MLKIHALTAISQIEESGGSEIILLALARFIIGMPHQRALYQSREGTISLKWKF